MNLNFIRNVIRKYPTIASVGHNLIKQYWFVRAKFMDYEYPIDNSNSIPLDEIEEYNKHRIFGPKKRLCYAPFNNIHFQMNGDVTLCSFNTKLLIGNVEKETLKEIWSNSTADQFRKNILDYNLDECSSCKLAFDFKNYSSFPATKYDFFSDDDNLYPTQMSFEISNLCNYECIMCNEDFSSSLRKRKGLKELRYKYPQDFVEQLKEFIPHLKIATFIGGEPFLIKEYLEIWEEICIRNKNCKIHIQTNGSFLPRKFLKLVHSKQFEIGLSIDSLEKSCFEIIRVNSKFDQVLQNINSLLEYHKSRILSLNINFCMMNINWKELQKIFIFCNENEISLKIIQVNMPFNFDIKNMPYAFIDNVYNELLNFIKQFKVPNNVIIKRNFETFNNTLNSVSNFKNYALGFQAKFEQFKDFNLNELRLIFYESLLSFDAFSSFDSVLLQKFYDQVFSYVDRYTNDEELKRRVLIKALHYFSLEHKLVESNLSLFEIKKLFDGFFELEKYISELKTSD